jgi:hypothetical protein
MLSGGFVFILYFHSRMMADDIILYPVMQPAKYSFSRRQTALFSSNQVSSANP